uniref:Uncharacterized protein n=1 Tax=Biomphalaria glabrata TaxID=6526 RepID=A0A2C9LP80_BIOGL
MEEPLEVVWLRSKTPMCKPNKACLDYLEVKTYTSIVYLKDHLVQCSLTLRNVTTKEESYWSLKYLGLASLKRIQPLFTCSLKAFVIVNRPIFSDRLNDAVNQKLFPIEEHESKDLIEDLEIKKKIINV